VPTSELPRLLADFNRPAGLIKRDYGDFQVEEIPLYPPAGSGSHTYFLIEKSGLTTAQAVDDLARVLGVRRFDIGYAGLKDARAVTRQWMSVEHVPPERVAAVNLPRLQVLEVSQHRNKLRLGHLQGNHFRIRVRQTAAHRLAELQDALARLAAAGVPNFFGPQRFGERGDTWEVGRAVVRGNLGEALDVVLGRPRPTEHGSIRHARELYQSGHYDMAVRHWPGMFHDARRALKALIRSKGDKKRAFLAIDRNTRQFYISAYQSYLFNQVLAERLPSGLGQLQAGDLAWLHRNGAVFAVEDAAAEQSRADAFEISPTGPLFGYRMSAPSGAAGELEEHVLAREELSRNVFRSDRLRIKGGRRPLRFPITDARIQLGADEAGTYLELSFSLPRGCYATTVLSELFDLSPGAREPAEAGLEEDAEEA
jgi:tRNA pseudouridine13 synthase